MRLLRRRVLQILPATALVLFSRATGLAPELATSSSLPSAGFDFDFVDGLARERAARPYQERSPPLPASLADLGYDQYRDIRFRPERALWRGQSLFEVQFFHRGFNFDDRVNFFEVNGRAIRPIEYSANLFEFAKLQVPRNLPPSTGFGGFRVHYPLHTPLYKDE